MQKFQAKMIYMSAHKALRNGLTCSLMIMTILSKPIGMAHPI